MHLAKKGRRKQQIKTEGGVEEKERSAGTASVLVGFMVKDLDYTIKRLRERTGREEKGKKSNSSRSLKNSLLESIR